MRRNSGLAFVALASIAVGYTAWAAEPSSATQGTTNAAGTAAGSSATIIIEAGEQVLSLNGDALLRIEVMPSDILPQASTHEPKGSPPDIPTVAGIVAINFEPQPQRQVVLTIAHPSQPSLPSQAIHVTVLSLEGDVVGRGRPEGFTMDFAKGCTVKWMSAAREYGQIAAPVCRMHGPPAPKP